MNDVFGNFDIPILDTLEFPVSFQLHGVISTVGIWDIIDILIVGAIIYKAYEMLQDTRAITLVKGLLVLMGLTVICNFLELHVMYWLLQKSLTVLLVALPIVFQPELRRALEHIGQGKFLAPVVHLNDEEAEQMIKEIDKAAMLLSKRKIGALIVFEREMGLNDISATGIKIDALVTADFLINVFIPNTPLHDGAAIIRGKRLVAAGCLLPLTENRTLSTELGTRHRAGLGLSEQCDALVLIVSEETGKISIAENGHLVRGVDSEMLRKRLLPIFTTEKPGIQFKDIKESFDNWRRKE